MEEVPRVSQSPSQVSWAFFHRRLQQVPAPQVTPCFSQWDGVGMSCHHHQLPAPVDASWGPLAVVGSVLSSLSWQLHLNPMRLPNWTLELSSG